MGVLASWTRRSATAAAASAPPPDRGPVETDGPTPDRGRRTVDATSSRRRSARGGRLRSRWSCAEAASTSMRGRRQLTGGKRALEPLAQLTLQPVGLKYGARRVDEGVCRWLAAR